MHWDKIFQTYHKADESGGVGGSSETNTPASDGNQNTSGDTGQQDGGNGKVEFTDAQQAKVKQIINQEYAKWSTKAEQGLLDDIGIDKADVPSVKAMLETIGASKGKVADVLASLTDNGDSTPTNTPKTQNNTSPKTNTQNGDVAALMSKIDSLTSMVTNQQTIIGNLQDQTTQAMQKAQQERLNVAAAEIMATRNLHATTPVETVRKMITDGLAIDPETLDVYPKDEHGNRALDLNTGKALTNAQYGDQFFSQYPIFVNAGNGGAGSGQANGISATARITESMTASEVKDALADTDFLATLRSALTPQTGENIFKKNRRQQNA